MLIFAMFTLGYFAGVITALMIFSPRTREIEEQEFDSFAPIQRVKSERQYGAIAQQNLTEANHSVINLSAQKI